MDGQSTYQLLSLLSLILTLIASVFGIAELFHKPNVLRNVIIGVLIVVFLQQILQLSHLIFSLVIFTVCGFSLVMIVLYKKRLMHLDFGWKEEEIFPYLLGILIFNGIIVGIHSCTNWSVLGTYQMEEQQFISNLGKFKISLQMFQYLLLHAKYTLVEVLKFLNTIILMKLFFQLLTLGDPNREELNTKSVGMVLITFLISSGFAFWGIDKIFDLF